MNDPQEPNKTEQLLGIFDIKWSAKADGYSSYYALFRWKVITFRMMMGGTPIIESENFREEWREITEDGCFPKYKIT